MDLQVLIGELESLRGRLAAYPKYRSRLDRAIAKLRHQDVQIAALTRENAEMRTIVDAAPIVLGKIDDLQKQNDDQANQISSLTSTNKSQADQINTLNQQVADLTAKGQGDPAVQAAEQTIIDAAAKIQPEVAPTNAGATVTPAPVVSGTSA